MDARYWLAETYFKLGNLEKALENYGRAYTTDPTNPLAIYALYSIGWIQEKNEDLDSATKAYQKLIREFPDDPMSVNAQFRAGFIASAQNEHSEAISLLSSALQSAPAHKFAGQARITIAESLVQAGRRDKAEEAFLAIINSAAQDEYTDAAYYGLGWLYYDEEKYSKAAETFKALSTKLPDSPLASSKPHM